MNSPLLKHVPNEIESRWRAALPYFKSREAVVFLSYQRFWENHGFVEQSLARYLIENGVKVLWFDGVTYEKAEPSLPWKSDLLEVRTLRALHGTRFSFINRWNTRRYTEHVLSGIRRFKNPILWVQGGFDPGTLAQLPDIDVYSTFDDAHRHSPESDLCRRAKVILCQNSYALRLMTPLHAKKSFLALPPVDIRPNTFDLKAQITYPKNFPARRMGYVGSFFPEGFDFPLFETFIQRLPDWGFVLQGRTDAQGDAYLNRLGSANPNFIRLPWGPREKIGATWRSLKLTQLFYMSPPSQAGAFPTKLLESLYFGVPAIATQVPWTDDLDPWIPRSNDPDRLIQMALTEAEQVGNQTQALFEYLSYEMNPRLQLAKTAERLSESG